MFTELSKDFGWACMGLMSHTRDFLRATAGAFAFIAYGCAKSFQFNFMLGISVLLVTPSACKTPG